MILYFFIHTSSKYDGGSTSEYPSSNTDNMYITIACKRKLCIPLLSRVGPLSTAVSISCTTSRQPVFFIYTIHYLFGLDRKKVYSYYRSYIAVCSREQRRKKRSHRSIAAVEKEVWRRSRERRSTDLCLVVVSVVWSLSLPLRSLLFVSPFIKLREIIFHASLKHLLRVYFLFLVQLY